ncbi:MAG: hypothetical protein BHW55_06335 [Candidatus Melainabacteria bacterium 35_41]|nr:MAG: hypothetical protein BHW55_06335 [Candidatus Melainabacteria bacterium 35_41]
MKKFLIFAVSALGLILAGLYLAFLFYLPKAVDLNEYKPLIQEIAKEQANIDVNFENPQIVTTPSLQAGFKTGEISIKLPDGSVLFSADSLQGRISLPSLILLTVKVSCAEVISPRINLDIENGEQFKVVRLVEDILNKQKNAPPKEEVQPLPFDPSIIKIKVPNAKITDYKAVINDLKSGHSLTLTGEKLTAGYNNGKTARIKTYARLLSDDKTNITANVNISSFIPPAKPADPDDDPAEKIELPFVNPVLIYRDYDLKSNIDTKLKIRQNENGLITLKGYFNIDNTTMNLSGLQLPESYIKSKFYGTCADLDTNIFLAKNQNINLKGKIGYGKKPFADISLITERIFFNDMIILSKALLDTLHIKNDLASLKGNGYWAANTQIKTDLKKIQSKGCIIARNGSISNGITKLVFDKINANLIFQDNMLKVVDTHTYINGNVLKAEGQIDSDSTADLKIHSEKLPLPGLFLAFAPSDLKKSFILSSGNLSLDGRLQGELKKSLITASVTLKDFVISDKNNSMIIGNEKLIAGIVSDLATLDGNIINKNLSLTLPLTGSIIRNPKLEIKLDENDINVKPFELLVNSNSKINLLGSISSYSSSPLIDLKADGHLNSVDLRRFAGHDAEPFIDAQGNIPVKVKITGNDKKQSIIAQLKSDAQNYITPVHIQSMQGKQSILQAKIDYKGDRVHIRNTGFYTGTSLFGDDLALNTQNAKEVFKVSGTIVNLNTAEPFINLIRISIPEEINAKLTAFTNSNLKANGRLLIFGKLASPLMRGSFKVKDLRIPEIFLTMDEADVNLSGKNIVLAVRRLLLNGSDINITARTDINPHPQFTLSRLDVRSRFIDLDRLMKVPDALAKYTAPPLPSSKTQTADIPVVIRNGLINIRRIKTGEIIATNTTGRISMSNNNFFLNNLRTTAFDGIIRGDITANLITTALQIRTRGTGLNVEKALLALANMKDTLSGDLAFRTDITLSGSTMEEQMKSLKGTVTFAMTDGQLGPFGKLENMILAENIRESQFFQTALGGVINNLATVDTSHFSLMNGQILFDNGIAHINPITTIGNVMCLHISGDFNLLENTTDMKVRAKLGSVIANMLGPIAQLNPINLVQATPGLNVVMAQAFSLFCEQLTPEESAAIPNLPTKLDDNMATKFQIVLRGDVAKPMSLIKSFKWLALASEIEQAQNFVSTLPDPSIVEDPNNATIEAILKAQELQAKEDAKLTNKLIRFFKKKK